MVVAITLLVIVAILGGLIALLVKVRRKNSKGKEPKTLKDHMWTIIIWVIALAIIMLFSLPRMWWKQHQIDEITNSTDTSQQAP